jgi:hypothetical protein
MQNWGRHKATDAFLDKRSLSLRRVALIIDDDSLCSGSRVLPIHANDEVASSITLCLRLAASNATWRCTSGAEQTERIHVGCVGVASGAIRQCNEAGVCSVPCVVAD